MDADKPARWRQFLEEDNGSAQTAEQLQPTLERLQSWEAPQAEASDSARLIQQLLAEMPVRRGWQQRLAEWWPWLLLRSQLAVVRNEIWLASALVLALGTIITLISYGGPAGGAFLPLVLTAPVITAASIAYLYGPELEPVPELELATPVPVRWLLLARLLWLFGFNLALGLVGSGFLALTLPGVTFWPLVLAWLAPMTFLSALALLLSILTGEPLVGVAVALALWGGQALQRFITLNQADLFEGWPDLTNSAAQPWLLLAALPLALLAVWLAGRENGWLARARR